MISPKNYNKFLEIHLIVFTKLPEIPERPCCWENREIQLRLGGTSGQIRDSG